LKDEMRVSGGHLLADGPDGGSILSCFRIGGEGTKSGWQPIKY